jgi:hypothetical protein
MLCTQFVDISKIQVLGTFKIGLRLIQHFNDVFLQENVNADWDFYPGSLKTVWYLAIESFCKDHVRKKSSSLMSTTNLFADPRNVRTSKSVGTTELVLIQLNAKMRTTRSGLFYVGNSRPNLNIVSN